MNSLKTYLLGLICIVAFQQSFSQNIVRTTVPDTIKRWESKNTLGLDLTQIAFVNWSAGGENAISGILKGAFVRKYTKGRFIWHNELIARYGLNKQDGIEARKTDDVIQLNSTAGFKTDTISNWYYSAKFNFNTQFTNGYAYPNTDLAISRPFAPAYVFFGLGTEYVKKEGEGILRVYVSPLTFKTTLVLDERLADQGSFGVDKATYDANGNLISHGKKTRTEMGFLVTNQYKKEIFKNIMLDHRLVLYTDYIKNFGNIDIDWQVQMDMIVNSHVRANISTNLIYDDDIKSKDEVDGVVVTRGPKVQLKQILGLGLSYVF
ncbi:hypothetical protein FEDK69T_12430 [Flavobacterium enshiense DK69]|uniref:DUF3078 domain-containing protein n=1 Tax=Flavobacterium enshiense DK69 TaxID=1107311 RepID=V6S8W3_9FLAO|nr:DUF3078 domain-containing protein [Flavobacterium enshiense]ESU23096.1 hypothetical protein FEDK69T_12430 [Flavobacterium enshiense DK69]KGO96040.1 hypothetical protein Q767_07190 [Flavobacterium enshiense DK69]